MTNVWFVLVPKASEMNVAGTVPDAFVVELAEESAVGKQLTSNYTGKVTVGGKSGYLRAGPFTSLADAQAYLKVGAQTVGTQIPGVSIAPSGQITVSNPLKGIEAIGAFFNKLGELNTWLRIVKVVAGAVLLISGIIHMTGIDKAALGVASKGVLPV